MYKIKCIPGICLGEINHTEVCQNMEKRIRILRIIGQCKTGGTEAIALNYYRNLDHSKIGMDFLFYGESLKRFNEELEPNGDCVINVTDYENSLLKSITDIRDVVKKGNYDIVHAQLNALNFFPLFGAKLGGAKVRLASNHSTANIKYEFKKSIIKYLVRPSSKWMATNYAACSEHAGSWCFGKKALAQGKIKIIHNAIDLSQFTFSEDVRARVRENMGWDGKFVIGHAGRFTEQKNHKFIVEIFSKVHEKCNDSVLVLAGEGHLMETIKKQVHELGLDDSVVFLGLRFDMNELMQGMDIFLFPSLYEGLGNVITEAQAVGLRSVVSDAVPKEVQMTDLVDFHSLKDPVETWVNTITKYSKGYSRENTHKQITEAGYEIKTASKDLENYYISLLKSTI